MMKFMSRSEPTLWSAEPHEHGIDAALANGLAQAVDDVLDREGSFFEELFHQRVVAFGDHFDQRFMGFLRGFGEIVRDGDFLALAVAIHGVGVGLHADQVDHALEIFFSADGKLNGNGEAAEDALNAFEGAVKGRTLAIELVNEDGAGQIELVGKAPDLFGLDFDARDAIDDDQRGVGCDERSFGVVEKNIEAGGVDED